MQRRLLRALETGEIRRVGAEGGCGVNVRIISGASTSLGDLITRGTFREDLYWRLNVIHVHVPLPQE
jgi:two-component system nitrogen regulation response regulator GlnG